MTPPDEEAVRAMATIFRWDKMSSEELKLLLWGLFRYFILRLP